MARRSSAAGNGADDGTRPAGAVGAATGLGRAGTVARDAQAATPTGIAAKNARRGNGCAVTVSTVLAADVRAMCANLPRVARP